MGSPATLYSFFTFTYTQTSIKFRVTDILKTLYLGNKPRLKALMLLLKTNRKPCMRNPGTLLDLILSDIKIKPKLEVTHVSTPFILETSGVRVQTLYRINLCMDDDTIELSKCSHYRPM